jgi:hypothetical protein
MSVHDRAVYAFLHMSVRHATGSNITDKLENVWKFINGLRNRGNCDENLAVAEHYLYARY